MTTTPMSDSTDIAVDQMTLAEVSRELAAYRPGNASELVTDEEWLARRMRLWRRLDELNGIRRPAIARPVAG
jgi:hypothetical protein